MYVEVFMKYVYLVEYVIMMVLVDSLTLAHG